MDEKLRELKARTAGATHRDAFHPARYYRRNRHDTDLALWNEAAKRLGPWQYYGTYPPESAERI